MRRTNAGPPRVDPAPARARIAQSYLAGIGASGAVLAGAAVAFVSLVGLVSFDVWPEGSGEGPATVEIGPPEKPGSAPKKAIVAFTAPPPAAASLPPGAPASGGKLGGDGKRNPGSPGPAPGTTPPSGIGLPPPATDDGGETPAGDRGGSPRDADGPPGRGNVEGEAKAKGRGGRASSSSHTGGGKKQKEKWQGASQGRHGRR